MITVLSRVCTVHKIEQGSITLYCDNINAVRRLQQFHKPVPVVLSNYDMIYSCCSLLSRLAITVRIAHVKGHQDAVSDRTLSLPEQLNCLVDRKAKAYLAQLAPSPTTLAPPQSLPSPGTHLYAGGARFHHFDAERLRFLLFKDQMKAHLHTRGVLSQTAFDEVDWAALGDALEGSPSGFKIWAAKHLTDQCATGVTMYNWEFWDSNICPLCNAHPEDIPHLMNCDHPPQRTLWIKLFQRFERKLTQLETHPRIIQSLLTGVAHPQASFALTHGSPAAIAAAATQQSIGHRATLEGRISKKWRALQGTHYQQVAPTRRPSTWAKAVSFELLLLSHDMWTA